MATPTTDAAPTSSKTITESQSWGDTIRSYENSKKSLPWNVNDVKPVERMSQLERRLKEREMDPILMAYRDPNKEAQITQTLQQQQQQKALNKTIKIPKRNYNIITHSGQKKESFHPSATRGDGTNPSSLDRNQREYNLLSHFNTKYHSVAPLEYDENISKHLLYKKIIPKKENYRSREFNILSNQYHQEHEDKQLQDHLIYQEKMKEKYWETHDYDLIKGQNYDEMKEKQYQEEMEKKRNQQLQKREQKFPKSVVYAEGNTYNILSQEITHQQHYETLQNEICNRSLNKYKRKEIFQQTITEMNIQNDLLQENRKLNRISIQRYDKSLSRGYNPITSQKLSTMEQFYSNSRIKKPISVWEKLLIPGSEIETGKNEIPPSHTRYDISQNHGNNLDWDIDEKRNIPQEEKKNHTSGMQSSKSLTQLTKPSSPSPPYTLNKNNSTPLLRPMTIATERVPLPPSSAATATSSSRAKYTVPSLDLTKTSMSVRTGGIGEY